MDDNVKYIDKQIEKNHIEARAAQQRAIAERNQADQYTEETESGKRDYHLQQAERFDQDADQHEAEAAALEPKKAQIEARIGELKAERERINRETLDRTIAIDKELARLQGSMTL
ncbi:MAG: hypothetical protein JWO54_309 [Candidatus Saccharibacteria bacterium]|nr:hypothetical protein [Candidatus Saccharibacteria bacterium]MDB5180551.1 hypothetical protein [Candidatus Saccharibacteria bacterium]